MTPRQHSCLEAIKRLTVDGVPPTYRQLRAELGLASLSGVHRLVHGLRERGLVTFEAGRHATLRVGKAGELPFDEMAEAVYELFADGEPSFGAVKSCLMQAAGARQ